MKNSDVFEFEFLRGQWPDWAGKFRPFTKQQILVLEALAGRDEHNNPPEKGIIRNMMHTPIT